MTNIVRLRDKCVYDVVFVKSLINIRTSRQINFIKKAATKN